MDFRLTGCLGAILLALTFIAMASPPRLMAAETNETAAGQTASPGRTDTQPTSQPMSQPTPQSAKLAGRAESILAKYCARCHKGDGSQTGYAFNVLNVPSLVDPAQKVVVAKKPDESALFEAMYDNRMPPRNQASLPRPSAEEIDTIKRWIAAGAPDFPKPIPRSNISIEMLLKSIKQHFDNVAPKDREYVRYFTLTHLHNDPTVDTRHLRMVRAALAKALNSLSWQAELVRPQVVDEGQTIYAVDIRQLGWTRGHWGAILREYPYGLRFGTHPNLTLQRLDEDLRRLADGDGELLHLRADWFVSVGLKPKLYHALLYDLTLPALRQRAANPAAQPPTLKVDPSNPLGMTDRDLEAELKIDVFENAFAALPKAQRAAFTESGISGQNRMIERHPLANRRSYWKSYDFLASNRQANLSEFPLGPKEPRRNPYNEKAFQHDGGEIIFTLPNGLQGYLLAAASGARLNAGPIEIVGDGLKTAGNQLIVNGLSCIVCHREGMVEPPDDEARGVAKAIGGPVRLHIDRLYPESKDMRQLIDADRNAFIAAYEKCVAEYLLQGEDQTANLLSMPEPIGETSRRFLLESLSVETIAAELFETNVHDLKVLLERNPVLVQAGLGALRRDGGRIKRDAWESVAAFSLMQEVARELGFTPVDF